MADSRRIKNQLASFHTHLQSIRPPAAFFTRNPSMRRSLSASLRLAYPATHYFSMPFTIYHPTIIGSYHGIIISPHPTPLQSFSAPWRTFLFDSAPLYEYRAPLTDRRPTALRRSRTRSLLPTPHQLILNGDQPPTYIP